MRGILLNPLLGVTAKAMRSLRVAIILAIFAISSSSAVAESQTADSVISGCSGGFTGGGGGSIINRDGLLLRWSRATRRDEVKETVIRSDPKEVRRVFTQLEKMKFTSIKYNKFGNMTCFLTLRQGSSSHAVSWEFGDPLAPSQVVSLAMHLQQLGSPAATN